MARPAFQRFTRHARHRDQHGVVAIELAIIAPVLVLIIVGVLRFGIGQIERHALDRMALDVVELAAQSDGLGADSEGLIAAFEITSWDVQDSTQVRLRIQKFTWAADSSEWERQAEEVDFGTLADTDSRITDGSTLQPGCIADCLAGLMPDPINGESILVLEVWRADSRFQRFGASGFSGPATLYTRAAQLERGVPDPCAFSAGLVPGIVCADGSVFAGVSPDGAVDMFVPRCDVGQSFVAGACTGTRTMLSANDWDDTDANHNGSGASDGNGVYDDTEAQDRGTFVAGPDTVTEANGGDDTGEANTAFHLSRADAGSPYPAAVACDGLDVHDRDDWYLPAVDELAVLYGNRAAVGGFYDAATITDRGTADQGLENYEGVYWSSTERDGDRFRTWYVPFADGIASGHLSGVSAGASDSEVRYFGYGVRCARKRS